MKQTLDFAQLMREALEPAFPLRPLDIGADARLSKKGFVFETECFEAQGLGQLCILRMTAMLGLMKMQTAVLAPFEKDLPLLNLDWVSVPGKTTQIAELYDAQLAPWPEEAQAAFQALLQRDADLPTPPASAHWYDPLLYPCSYHKAGKGIADRLAVAAADYARLYAAQAAALPACDSAAKREKVREFAETLYAQGGPAVDQVKRLFGEEITRRLIVRHMYGI